MEDVKRPESALKKGASSWKPASVTDVTNKEPGYRYRWVNKDPDNLAKKQIEQWEYVDSKADSAQTAQSRLEDGNSMTSVYEKKDVVLMRLPEEIAEGRDAYMNERADRRIEALKQQTQGDLNKQGAAMHGDITISSRKA